MKKNILILRFSALGDVAMTLPVIYSLARQYPDLQVTVLTRPFFARLFVNRPSNIRLMETDFKGIHKGLGGVLRLLGMLRICRFDGIADLHNVLRSWLIDLFFLWQGKKVVMVDKQRRGRRKVLSEHARQVNYVHRYAEVFARLGFPVKLTFRSVYESVPPEVPLRIDRPAVGIAPFARYFNKIYPLEKMLQVANLLATQGFHVYFFGGGDRETKILNSWQQDCPNSISLAGKYSLEEELAIMSHIDVMITMDSANQHLAALTGTKVISVWGSTTPACGFAGYNQDERNAVCLNLPCQPCSIAGGKECPRQHLDCLNRIEPAAIAGKVSALILNKS